MTNVSITKCFSIYLLAQLYHIFSDMPSLSDNVQRNIFNNDLSLYFFLRYRNIGYPHHKKYYEPSRKKIVVPDL